MVRNIPHLASYVGFFRGAAIVAHTLSPGVVMQHWIHAACIRLC